MFCNFSKETGGLPVSLVKNVMFCNSTLSVCTFGKDRRVLNEVIQLQVLEFFI